MAINTYATLKTAVGNWLNRSDLTSYIPDFVTIAEGMIARDLKSRANEKRVTASISTQYSDLPTDFISGRNVQINGTKTKKLEYLLPEQIDEREMGSSSGEPKAYTFWGDELQLAPSPDAAYTIEIGYYAKLAAFSADADTNWVLTNHPDIYLYGSLSASEAFLQNDDRIAVWKTLYKQSIKELNDAEKKGRFSGSALRARNIGAAV
jgi:hypothetical protein